MLFNYSLKMLQFDVLISAFAAVFVHTQTAEAADTPQQHNCINYNYIIF